MLTLTSAAERQLDEYLENCEEDTPTDGTAPFVCDTLEKALWVADRLRRNVAKCNEIRQAASARREHLLAELQTWEEDALRPLDSDGRWMEQQLRGYHQRELEANPRAKTLTLPGGLKARFRKFPDTWERDEVALLETMKGMGDAGKAFIRVRESLAWAVAKKACAVQNDGTVVFTPTGEVLPGVTVIPGEVQWTVSVVTE